MRNKVLFVITAKVLNHNQFGEKSWKRATRAFQTSNDSLCFVFLAFFLMQVSFLIKSFTPLRGTKANYVLLLCRW